MRDRNDNLPFTFYFLLFTFTFVYNTIYAKGFKVFWKKIFGWSFGEINGKTETQAQSGQ